MHSPDARQGVALTDPGYWTPYWKSTHLPQTLDTGDPVIRELVQRIGRYARLGPGARVLEVGCAASPWMPFFHRQWGWTVEGVDYTTTGAETARRNLAILDVPGTVYETDIFDFPATHEGCYDLVASFGVVEHFMEPRPILQAMYSLLKPGGRIVVEVPHVRGLGGWLQRFADKAVLDLHNPLMPIDLKHHLADAGFICIMAGFVGREPLRVINWPRREALPAPIRRTTYLAQGVADKLIAATARPLDMRPRWVATYVLACGTRPTR